MPWLPRYGRYSITRLARPLLEIQFSTSTAFSSGVIRRLCHSPFSHCDIVIPGEGLLGVSGEDKSIGDIGGVQIRKFGMWPYLHPPRVARLTTAGAEAIIEKGKTQIGKPFDNSALYGFLEDMGHSPRASRDWRDHGSWFCSEYVAWVLESSHFFPYTLISAKNRITPADLLLLLNPFMSEDNIREF